MTALADDIIQSTIDRCDSSVLTRMDERRLFGRLAQGDRSAREKLFEHNVRLVASISYKYERPAFSREEAFQEGCLGLLHAIDKFDLSFETKFSTYAAFWIKAYCQRGQYNQARMIRLPVHQEHFMSRVKRAEAALVALLERPVSPEEIAAELGEDPIKIVSLSRAAEAVSSLNFKVGETKDTEFGDLLPDLYDEYAEVDDRIANETLYEALDLMLDPRSRELIVRRWGLEGHQPQTLQAIADHFNISRERVRQIETKALVTLKMLCLWTTRDSWTPTSVVPINLTPSPEPDQIEQAEVQIEQQPEAQEVTPEAHAQAPSRYKNLTNAQVAEIRLRHAAGETQKALYTEFGVSPSAMYRILKRKTIKCLTTQKADYQTPSIQMDSYAPKGLALRNSHLLTIAPGALPMRCSII